MTAKIKLNAASGGGSFSLQAPSSSSNNRVFTLPDVADTTMATVNGITMADQWRITSSFVTTGAYFTANWERNDTDFAYIGSGMTESSGVFTFPSTGIYLISAFARGSAQGSTSSFAGIQIELTTDNSSYTNRADSYDSTNFTNGFSSMSIETIFDVTNTSTHKCKMYGAAANSFGFNGHSDKNLTGMTFIRLGDT